MSKISNAVVRRAVEILSNSHDTYELITDREMLALAMGMMNAAMMEQRQLPDMTAEQLAEGTMKSFRIAVIQARAMGRDLPVYGMEEEDD